ncbi:MAG: polyribonucleotide nucleotidyltransferase [Armatimonadetes bacterium CG07_land_8_20_14_0_80_40_9]|nr:MAG: polyribonucleotide nucleotidyltransferase [Armatimonadetes bacterium CG07_land_8_20_14_0_80_40_9]
MKSVKVQMDLEGKMLSLEAGKIAQQANGAVVVSLGDTIILVTAVASREPREDIDFFPLTCNYEEKLYAAGKIPGGFIKREGRPTEKAILTSRLIDRPIRPLFPEGFHNDVQIVATPLSADSDNAPDVLAMLGASSALLISDIPFSKPIGALRVARENNHFIVNPTYEQINKSDLDLIVAGTYENLSMVEAKCREVSEEVILSAIEFAQEYINRVIKLEEQLLELVGKPKQKFESLTPNLNLERKVREFVTNDLKNILGEKLEKSKREEKIREVEKRALANFSAKEEETFKEEEIKEVINGIEKEIMREGILGDHIRVDGRGLSQVRPITCEVGLLPRAHGSGLFVRGETQVITIATLGAVGDEQIIDGLGDEESKRFMHQYNFPPYSVGETRPIRGPGRREIGHGALAEKALEVVIPDQSTFPYTIRLVSEVLSSNGSTSMASVCGGTLSLMDAGVPIKSPVAGIAMGLISSGGEAAILSDIQGIEDAFGDMDLKVAGTRQGITALQMDIKTEGISSKILEQALNQAKEGRLFILDKMLETLPQPRANLSSYAPRIFTLEIPQDKIGGVIGPGGKMIRKIIEETGAKIDIEDSGQVFISTPDEEAGKRAVEMIESLVKEVKPGETYVGKVLRITNFGAFVEILPGKDGLLHISQLSWERVEKVEDVIKVGEKVKVKVIGIDEQGRINLSRKSVLPPPTKARTTWNRK